MSTFLPAPPPGLAAAIHRQAGPAAGERASARQPYREAAPQPRSGALGTDSAAVHLHQRLDHAEADAQPSLDALHMLVHLHEAFEHPSEHIAGDADAIVLDDDSQPLAVFNCAQGDMAARGRVLGRVVQEVADHLHQPGNVAVHMPLRIDAVPQERVALRIQQRPAGVHRVGQHRLQLQRLAP